MNADPQPKKATLLRRLLATVLAAAFLGYLWSIREQFIEGFAKLSAAGAGTLAGVLVLYWAVRSWRDWFLYRALGHRPRVSSIFWLNTLQVALNYLPLKAGTFSSAALFRSRLAIPYREFALALGQQYLLTIFASSLLAAAALGFVPGLSMSVRAMIVICLIVIGAGCFVLLRWPGCVQVLPAPIARRLEGGAEKFAVFRNGPREALSALALTVPMCMLGALRMIVVYGVLTLHLSWPAALVIQASMQLSAMASITPAGIGIVESAVALSSVLVAHTAEVGVIAATMDRVVLLALSIGLGLLLYPLVRPFQPDSRRES